MRPILASLFVLCAVPCMCAAAVPDAGQRKAAGGIPKRANNVGTFATGDLPLIVFKETNREIEKFKYLGPWTIPAGANAKDALQFSIDSKTALIKISSTTGILPASNTGILPVGSSGMGDPPMVSGSAGVPPADASRPATRPGSSATGDSLVSNTSVPLVRNTGILPVGSRGTGDSPVGSSNTGILPVNPPPPASPIPDASQTNNQLSIFAFRAVSEYPRSAILKIEADGQISAYLNGKSLDGIPGAKPHDYGARLFVPLALEKGINIVCLQLISRNGPPRFRLTAMLERSMDFQAAWESNESLLAKKIFYPGVQGGSPALKWNALLDRLRVSVEVLDVLKNEIVLKRDNLTNGSILREGQNELPGGLYKATYKTKQESASEFFVIGPPKTAFENLKQDLEKLTIPSDDARLNIDAQIRRGEILFVRENYDADNQIWQEKALYTLESLASMISMLRIGRESVSRDIPGLHIRGFRSKVDNSRQYYRLFIPSNYEPTINLPLLLILPTPFSAKQKPFIESRFMESHKDAVLISRFAEKHGFAVLWPGYRNVPDGWTCESTHIGEVIDIVGDDYDIDKERISVYARCGGGYFGGRLVASYPRRFAALVYDRAIFERNIARIRHYPEPLVSWYEAINPVNRVIDNNQLKIFVFNDGSKPPGHGEIELSEKFMESALEKRNDIDAYLKSRPLGIPLWDFIFNWLAPCKIEEYDHNLSGFPKKEGFEGPVSEIFSTPFIVVRGTAMGSPNAHVDSAIEHIKKSYKQQFYGAEPVVKNDHEITEQEMKDYSLILVGNPESNAIWKKLEDFIPIKATPIALSIKGHQFFTNSAFLAIFEHPLNAKRRILTIGSYDLKHLGALQKANPCNAWYDCRVFEPAGASYQAHTISKLGTIQ